MKKWICLLLAALLCLGIFCGCAKQVEETPAAPEQSETADTAPTEEQTETDNTEETASDALNADIVFWSSNTETSNYGQVISAAAEAFMQENPGVKIEISYQGTDIQSTLGPALDAGTKITMFEANTDASMVLWKDRMMDLGEYYTTVYPQTNGQPYGDSIVGAYNVLAKAQGDGEYLYFPYLPQFVNVWYNKDIFDACGITSVPTTWDELMDICQTLVDNGYTPFTSDQGHIHFSFGYYVQRRLGDDAAKALVNSTDGTEWSDPAVLEIAKKFEEAASKGYFASDIMTVVQPEAQQEMVIDKKIAMYVGGSWMPNNLRESAGEDFRWGSFTYPLVENGADDGSSLCYGCYGISINKDATKEEANAAAAFAVYLSMGEWGSKLVSDCNAIPIAKEGVEWPPMIADAQHIYDGITNRWTAQTAFALNNDLLPTVKSALTKLMGGACTAEDFIAEIQSYYK